MTRIQTALALVAALLAFPAFAGDTLMIQDPYARSMGSIGGSGAVFFTVMNHGAEEDRLIDVRSDVAEKVELHTHKEDGNGVMQMMHVPEGFTIAAGGEHALARGGDHVMLMGLTREVADGDVINLTLVFEKAGEIAVEAPVDNARKAEMDHSGHQMQHSQTDDGN